MKSCLKQRKRGITRNEVLVSLVLGFLLFFLVILPLVSNVRMEAAKTHYQTNARALYGIITLRYLDKGLSNEYRRSSKFLPDHTNPEHGKSSTDYFRFLIRNDVDGPENFISGPGVRAASRRETFTAANNAWSVVSGHNFETSSSSTPLIITRNLNESSLVDWRGREDIRLQHLGRKAGKEGWRTPFDRHYVVFIRTHGGGEVLQGDFLRWDILNSDADTNVILQP